MNEKRNCMHTKLSLNRQPAGQKAKVLVKFDFVNTNVVRHALTALQTPS